MKTNKVFVLVLLSVVVAFLSAYLQVQAQQDSQKSDATRGMIRTFQQHIIIKDLFKGPNDKTLPKYKDLLRTSQKHILISDYLSPIPPLNSVNLMTIQEDPYGNDGFDASWLSVRSFALVKPLKEPLKLYVDTRSALFKTQYVQFVQEGLAQWAKALGDRLSYRLVKDPENANIQIHWVNSFPLEGEAGITDMTIGKAIIQIKTMGIPNNILRGNILHELGHALGIEGHSRDNGDIMTAEHQWTSAPEYKNFEGKLSARDIHAIQTLYSVQWKKGEDLYSKSAK